VYYNTCYTSPFWNKSGLPIVCFHPTMVSEERRVFFFQIGKCNEFGDSNSPRRCLCNDNIYLLTLVSYKNTNYLGFMLLNITSDNQHKVRILIYFHLFFEFYNQWFFFWVKFCNLVTKKKRPCNKYKGLFSKENNGSLSSHYEDFILNHHILDNRVCSMLPNYNMIPKLFLVCFLMCVQIRLSCLLDDYNPT
jgi:hypothetical protein